MEIIKKGNVSFVVSEKLLASGVIHGFSLRHGGVSEGDFDSLNVGLRRGDNPFSAVKNIEICADALKLDKEKMTLTNQTHTNNVELVEECDIGKGLFREWGKGVDGVVTKMKNVPLMCYSADCVPTLLYDGENDIIGAIHGGWRGTKEEIVVNAVEKMVEAGAVKEKIVAFIGPAIGKCCYEVSRDVGEEFLEYSCYVEKKNEEKYMLDLKGITKAQLLRAGLCEENIENCELCTSCNNDLFFSHRAQKGRSGLLGGFIQMI